MATDTCTHEVAWLGLTLKVPEDWEIVRHSVAVQRGSLIFVDRRRQRLELGWLSVKSEPDLDHWASDLEQEQRRLDAEVRLRRHAHRGGWQALEYGRKNCEITTRAVRYEARSSQLIEAAIETRDGVSADRDLVAALLDEISVTAAPESARYFRAFDVAVHVPESLRLGAARVKPADVCFDFVAHDGERERERGSLASVERLGMVESWYNGDARALIQSRNPGSRFSSFSSARYAGHEATLAEGIEPGPLAKRALGLLRERRVLVFRCERQNALYALSTSSRKGERIEPQELRVQCCGGAS